MIKVAPFVTDKYANRGAFILCKTSNPSGGEVQDAVLKDGRYVYEHVLQTVGKWNNNKNLLAPSPSPSPFPVCGVVAGATNISALEIIRMTDPEIWILCPGVGAQGGDAVSVCAVGLRPRDGGGLLIAVSRGISRAEDKAKAARELCVEVAALRLLKIEEERKNGKKKEKEKENIDKTKEGSESLQGHQKDFIKFALSKQALSFGQFTLKSGRLSPYFFNAGMFCCGESVGVVRYVCG